MATREVRDLHDKDIADAVEALAPRIREARGLSLPKTDKIGP
jgi:hypothetical protein